MESLWGHLALSKCPGVRCYSVIATFGTDFIILELGFKEIVLLGLASEQLFGVKLGGRACLVEPQSTFPRHLTTWPE